MNQLGQRPQIVIKTQEEPMSEEQVNEGISQDAEDIEESSASQTPEDRDEKGRFQKKQTAQERIDELTAKYREEQRQRMIAEAQLQTQQQEKAPEPPKPLEEPKPEQFQTYEEYIDARSEYVAEKKMREYRDSENERSQQSNRIAKKAEFDKRGQEFAEKHPDYMTMVASIPSAWLPQDVADIIVDSPEGPQIAYHLAQNPQEAFRISQLGSPSQRAFEIGRINSAIVGRKTSNAPPPVEPVKSGGGGPSNWLTDMNLSPDEWARRRNEELAKGRR